jgi:hypothetical protein
MTNEERDIISQFIARVSGEPGTQGVPGGSVPATQPALPPVDRDADALIGQLLQKYPEARYRITQLAFVQEHALTEAQNRIQRLQYDLQQSQQALQQAQQAAQGSRPGSAPGGGFFSGLFGGNRQQSAPPPGGPWNQGGQPQQGYAQPQPPPPQYAPNYQPGMFQRQGSGFLGSALTTAAGVAGGLVAGNALMGLFSGREGGLGGGGFGGASAASPWANPAPAQNAVDTGSWDNASSGAPAGNQDYVDNGTWDQPTGGDAPSPDDSGGSWDSGGGGGWDSGSSNSDDTF